MKITDIIAAITTLTATPKYRSVNVPIEEDNIAEIRKGKKGARIATAANRQAPRFMKDHDWRIILALGASVKSAPLIPFDNETAPKATNRQIAVSDRAKVVPSDGRKITNPIVPVMARIMTEKKRMKQYLLFTKLQGEIGDEKIRHIACPSSPIMKLPKLIAIREAGIRKTNPSRVKA